MTASVLRQLRHPHDPTLRLKAIQVLAEMDHVDHAPYLIRAAVEDPDPQVRTAARQALLNLVGAETDLAIQTYRSAPDEDPWLVEQAEEDEADLSFEDDQYLAGLITVLRNHPDAQMRLKAIAEMKQNSDMRVIAALAETVLWTDDPDVRQAARQSLEARFGEETEEIIQSYQVQDYLEQQEEDEEDEGEWEDGPEEDGAEETEQPAPVEARWHAPTVSPASASQVVRNEGFPWLLVVIAVVGIVGMVIVILLVL